MVDYTADDGLKILAYLKLDGRLTAEEREVFMREWGEYYRQNQGNPIMTTWDLYYEICPFSMGANTQSQTISWKRDREFREALDKTNLDKFLGAGKNLRKILFEE